MKVQFQDWLVDTTLNQLQRGDERVQLEPLAMNVLICLLENADQVVPVDRLLDRYWSGRHAEPGRPPSMRWQPVWRSPSRPARNPAP